MKAPLPRGATDITPTEALEIAKENLYRARHEPMSDEGRDSLRIEATAYASLASALQAVNGPDVQTIFRKHTAEQR